MNVHANSFAVIFFVRCVLYSYYLRVKIITYLYTLRCRPGCCCILFCRSLPVISSWGFTLWLICRPVTFFGVFYVFTRLSGAILMSRSSCADKSLLSVVRGGIDFFRVIDTLWFLYRDSAVLLNLCTQLLEAVLLVSNC